MAFYPIGGKMSALVTGGAGFVGAYVVAQVGGYALDNLDPHCGGNANRPHIDCDVTNFDALEKVVLDGKFAEIVHLAAYGRNLTCRDFPRESWLVNVHGTRNVLEIAKRHPNVVKRVVCCSSNIVLSTEFTDYKRSKEFAEREIKLYAEAGVSCMGLRPSNLYGAGQSQSEHQLCAFAALDRAYKLTGHFEISGDGSQTRDWCHAEDAARAFEFALHSDIKGEVLDVCTGRQTSMNEIAKMLGIPVVYTAPRPGDAQAIISSPWPAATKLGFHAEIILEDRVWDAFPSVPKGGLQAISA